MLLGYAARNAINPAVQPPHVQAFQNLAMKQGQDLTKAIPGYHGIAGQIANRIQTLDPARRAAAHADLNASLLRPISAALTAGQTAPALSQIIPHIHRLAGQYGIPTAAATGGAVPGAAQFLAREQATRGMGGPMGGTAPGV